MDGLGQRLPHVLGHEHRVHLALPEGVPRARVALQGPPLDAVVPALRHLALAARAGRARRTTASSSTRRCTSASRWPTATASRWSSGRRRRGRCPRTSPRPSSRTPSTGSATAAGGWPRRAASTTTSSRARTWSGSSTTGRSTTCPRRKGVRHRVIPWDEVALDEGTGIVHIAPGAGAEDFELSRVHGLPVLAPIDESGRFLPGYGAVRGAHDRRRGAADHPRARRARRARRGRHDRPPLPDLLALQDAARLPRRGRLVHPDRGPAPAAARRERRGRLDAAELQEADGRLAAQHGRLEHLAQALLRSAAAVLSVRVRRAERDRLARRAGGARDRRARAAAGAAPALDRRGADPLRVLQRGGAPHPGGGRRLARRGHRPALDARLAEPGTDPAAATAPARRRA